MSNQNSSFQGRGSDFPTARYYNDAVIGLDIIYEIAIAGAPGARDALRNIAECVCRTAALWSKLYPHGEN